MMTSRTLMKRVTMLNFRLAAMLLFVAYANALFAEPVATNLPAIPKLISLDPTRAFT